MYEVPWYDGDYGEQQEVLGILPAVAGVVVAFDYEEGEDGKG